MAASVKPPPLSPPRLLLIEDDETVQRSLTKWLRQEGCLCDLAPDTASAKRLLAEREFDILLCDVNLPDGTGPELVAALGEPNRGVPVIFLTGQPSLDTAIRSVELRAVAYLVKPPDLAELRRLMGREVELHRQRRALATSRRRLHEWDEQLAQLEQSLDTPGVRPTTDYLQLTLAHLAAQFSDLDRAVALLAVDDTGRAALAQVDLVVALRRAVQVLEKTRDHFKSKDLAELRKELEQLLQHLDRRPPPKKTP